MMNLSETDVQDADGRVVISPGLKVRHKDSQYEYTVDSVVTDNSGEHVVVLRLPEQPRVDPGDIEEPLLSDLKNKEVIYEVDPDVVIYEPDDSDEEMVPDKDFLAVPEKEFEKDYEVN